MMGKIQKQEKKMVERMKDVSIISRLLLFQFATCPAGDLPRPAVDGLSG